MKHRNRSFRKFLRALVAVLLVVGVVSILLLGRAQKRREFTGNVDPESGFRCRCSISTVWQRTDNRTHLEKSSAAPFLDYDAFRYPGPGRLRRWIEAHLPHLPHRETPELYLRAFRKQDLPDYITLQKGYPALEPSAHDSLLKQRHLRIAGNYATVLSIAWTGEDTSPVLMVNGAEVFTDDVVRIVNDVVVSGRPYPYREHSVTVLLVYAPEAGLLYEVWGIGRTSDFDWIDHEMQAIVASFHIEKAMSPGGT